MGNNAGCCEATQATRSEELDIPSVVKAEAATHEDLIEALTQSNETGEGGEVQINLEVVETILYHEESIKTEGPLTPRCSSREIENGSETAERYLQKEELRELVGGSAEHKDWAANAETRRKIRKGTGFVTKETFQKALDKADAVLMKDNVVAPSSPCERQGWGGMTSTGEIMGGTRKKMRQGTGFVNKAKLQKALAIIDSEEN
eukprot:TRINITY_DN57953_c0_g1_i1.p1 TRINITY_DN57953_c0_g1~~TRINITY_DN57953_c0_g1_i1.p1  ORF type:complete len:204 (+),score=39.86 TRINITY_DN57953_c0_g1_i1:143-754(+)